MRRSTRAAIAVVAALAVLGPIGYFWYDSLVPGTYDMATMGYPDSGGGPAAGHDHGAGLSVADLRGPSGTPDVAVTLTARKDGSRYTLNGTSPGPEIRATRGQLIQVTLVNESVPDGVTLHWHGVDVPNGEDGVAGVTQDAVPRGQSFVYRFVAKDAGTYWYHSHQVSHEQVKNGLFGALVIVPRGSTTQDQVAMVHTYQGKRTINGKPEVSDLSARYIRLINTDAGPIRIWVSGTSFRLTAIDGHDVNQPGPIENQAVLVTAGGRVDLQLTAPGRVDAGGGAALVAGGTAAAPLPAATVDFLAYGKIAPLGFDPDKANRHFQYDIGRRFGFLDGRPGMWWTINGHLFPDVPMFMVDTGDVVRMTVHNGSGKVHPMHLHGHHVVVLSRNGVAATGSPWWTDSLDVPDGDTFEIAFVAGNPGIWADHCHNLEHVPEGLVAHLAYSGVRGSFQVGGASGNTPE
ncbi:metallo-oxidoreductase [Actinoplanes ianthinogenes]|uniref:Metallo-oxidoreductase n=1 Tax=Actinoplanes ianthinogenes TaxID=122358 RepID=A0ABM7LRJ5_9ACTN|nr:multicopper oxidase family protein [Actinoplanes ianthinogenes]BCJ41857.1 metallo-oxidoreductase [Actinoplanes ianthinogenes]GGR45571.1 metallo-oxidoreductase [Actinoplanes ianthinogenes]